MKYAVRKRPTSLVDSFLDDDFMNTFTYGSGLDIYQEGDDYVVELEMPGLSKDDIALDYKGDILTIKAEHRFEDEQEEKNYFYQSRAFHSVNRQIRFPDVDAKKITASYQDGVLKVVLPSKTEEEVHSTIQID
ncbi:MAG TPA: Hsp20/alpha crystallin family protein [Erysipelothrix sp.]